MNMSFVCLIPSFQKWFKKNVPEPYNTNIQKEFNISVNEFKLFTNIQGKTQGYNVENFLKKFIEYLLNNIKSNCHLYPKSYLTDEKNNIGNIYMSMYKSFFKYVKNNIKNTDMRITILQHMISNYNLTQELNVNHDIIKYLITYLDINEIKINLISCGGAIDHFMYNVIQYCIESYIKYLKNDKNDEYLMEYKYSFEKIRDKIVFPIKINTEYYNIYNKFDLQKRIITLLNKFATKYNNTGNFDNYYYNLESYIFFTNKIKLFNNIDEIIHKIYKNVKQDTNISINEKKILFNKINDLINKNFNNNNIRNKYKF
jgi:hypothetical protein